MSACETTVSLVGWGTVRPARAFEFSGGTDVVSRGVELVFGLADTSVASNGRASFLS